MSAASLISELATLGVRLARSCSRLVMEAPHGVLTADLCARVREHREEILAHVDAVGAAHSENANSLAVAHVAHGTHAKESHCLSSAEGPAGPPPVESSVAAPCAACAASAQRTSAGCTASNASSRPPVIVIDFECRSLCSLEEVGGRGYASHPSTEVLCAVAQLPCGGVISWIPGQVPPALLIELVGSGVPLVAHNALGFDRFIWERLAWGRAKWIDSLQLARLVGLPGALDSLGEALLGLKKDTDGWKLTLSLSRPDRATGCLAPVHPEQLARVVKYCVKDVEILAGVWTAGLAPAVGFESELRALDTEINDRGFVFDTELAHAVIDCEGRLAREAREHARVDARLLASPLKMKSWLAKVGIRVSDVRRGTLEALLEDADLPDDARAVLVARCMSAGIASHKLRSALRRQGADGRLRDTLVYHAAHTGRWSGHGFQPHNLPRGVALDIDEAVAAAMARDTNALKRLAASANAPVEAVLGTLVRPCVRAAEGLELGVVDYASIEARALMWLAGDSLALARFANGDDVYRLMAALLFHCEPAEVTKEQRGLGKAVELGCGYQMGALRLDAYAIAYGVDWRRVSVSPEHAVEAWRDAHPLVAGERTGTVYEGHVVRAGGLWREIERAAHLAAAGERVEVSRTLWERVGTSVVCTLPSGRKLVYPQVRVSGDRDRVDRRIVIARIGAS